LRGEFVDSAGPLMVRGVVTDDVGVAGIRLFGVDVAVAEDGSFAFDAPAPVDGMNIVRVEALDIVDRGAESQRAVLFGAFESPDEFRDDAVRVGMNPDLLDDDDPDMDDLAGIAEAAMDPAGWEAGSFGTDCGGRVFFTNTTFENPSVDLWPEAGGIGIRITVSNMSMDYHGRGCVDLGGCRCTDFVDQQLVARSVTVEADASLLVELCELSSESVPGDPHVDGLDMGLAGDQAQFEELVRAQAKEEVGSVATGLLLDIVEGAVDNALAKLAVFGPDSQARGLGVTPTPMAACVTAALFTEGGGHFDAGARLVGAGVGEGEGDVVLPEGAGVLTTPGEPPDTQGEGAFVFSVDDDLVNALLFDAWAAGVPLAPAGEAGDAITSALPPVVMTNPDAENGEPTLVLAFGEMQVEVSVEGGDATASVSVFVPAEAAADGEVLTIGPAQDLDADDLDMVVEIIDAPEGADHDAIRAAAQDRVADEVLVAMAADPVTFDLPEMPIDEFDNPDIDGGSLGMGPSQDGEQPRLEGENGDHITVRAPGQFDAPAEAPAEDQDD
jgi:hypothetical protein